MRLRVTRRAVRHLAEVRRYIALHNPTAAREVSVRLRDAIDGLLDFPNRGRPGRIAGTRELVVSPFIISYRVSADTADVLAIVHGAGAWPA